MSRLHWDLIFCHVTAILKGENGFISFEDKKDKIIVVLKSACPMPFSQIQTAGISFQIF